MTTAAAPDRLGGFPARSIPSLPAAGATVVPGGSVFGDEVWDLSPLCPRPTTRWIRLHFTHCPGVTRRSEALLLPAADDGYPVGAARPASQRPETARALHTEDPVRGPQTVLRLVRATRGLSALAQLDEDDLREYAAQVANAPVGQNPKSRRLFGLSRLWLLSPYMRPSARLRQPFWEREGMEQVIGKSEWTAENKSVPVHPATMSALLVWCLRLVQEAPRLLHLLSLSPGVPCAATGRSDVPALERRTRPGPGRGPSASSQHRVPDHRGLPDRDAS
jgi:hypothetical protein